MSRQESSTDEVAEQLARLPDAYALLAGLFAHSPVPHIVFDVEGRAVVANRAYAAMFGAVPPSEYSVLRDERAAHAGIADAVRRAFAGETITTPTFWYDAKEQRRAAIACTFFPLRTASGEVAYVALTYKDVTEQVAARLRAEALADALKVSETRYRLFVAASTEGIWRAELAAPIPVDGDPLEQVEGIFREAYIAECNDAMARMYGYDSASALAGARVDQLLVRDDPRNVAYLRAFVENGYRLEGVESVEMTKDGARRIFQNSLVGVVENGSLMRAWGTQRDVTAEVEARELAEKANRAKDEFLAMLGHELRNPLAPILTAIELMKMRGGASDFQKERDVIERQVRHVVRLVDDLLDVARMTQGKVTVVKRPLDIAECVAAAVELVSPRLREHAHALTIAVPKGLCVEGDTVRLTQVFANLLDNAAKYTPPRGEIRISAERAGDSVVVRVRDNGIGIRPEILPTIFETFAQERQALDRAAGGLGLGLAIVRSLVSLHGGKVEARSEGPGRGAEIIVSLPSARASSTEARAAPPSQERLASDGLNVLVVDDNEDAADLLAEALRAVGYEVAVAHDGASALRLLDATPPDIGVLDVGLPDMDGFELARRIHDRSGYETMPLVAVTGYGQESDRRAARAAGFSELLVKPARLDELGAMIRRLAPRRAARAKTAPPEAR